MLEEILTHQDCATCKKCCKFDPDEVADAPTFSPAIQEKILREIDPTAEFTPRGRLLQIILRKIPGQEKYQCPVLDEQTGCRLGPDRPFDCQAYPFYLMRLGEQLVLALSPDCPVVNDNSLHFLRDYARKGLLQTMLAEARRYPELITEYHGNATVLEVLQEKIPHPSSSQL